jgi:GT2 family glycosyltransferase
MNVILSLIIVNYNTQDLVIQCIQSVKNHLKGMTYELILVDNGSNDQCLELAKQILPDIITIKNTDNLGFASANNQGLRRAKGKYLCLLNSDTILIENLFSDAIQYFENNPKVGIIGPRVLNDDKSLQVSFGKYHSLFIEMLRTLNVESKYKKWIMKNDQKKWGLRPHQVDWVSGCCLLIRRDVIHQIGYLDEAFFLFNEEVDWCKRASNYQWQIVYFPQNAIIHIGSKSAVKNYYLFIYQRYISRLKYFQKHHSRSTVLIFLFMNIIAILIRLLFINFAATIESQEKKQRKKALKKSLEFYLLNDKEKIENMFSS